MTDFMTAKQRSAAMAKVKGKNTGIEKTVRSRLHSDGFRFRINDPGIPGKPDILLPKYRAAIFVNGCFWHGHRGCSKSKLPDTKTEFWTAKIDANKRRDEKNIRLITDTGWRVIQIWECALKDRKSIDITIAELEKWLLSAESKYEIPCVF